MTQQEFKILFDTHFDTIRNYLYYKSGNAELATDLTQETFLRIWEKQIQVDKERVKSLLYKIATNIYISFYRKKSTERKYASLFEFSFNADTPEEQLQYKELNQKYRKVLLEMPEKKRLVFMMSRMDGLKYSEIAQELDISVKAVEKRISEAIALLKDALLFLLLIFVLYRYL